jgi:hypothetical protein
MITPIDDTKASQNIFPVFRPIFNLIRKNYIQPFEKIFAVACCNYMNEYGFQDPSLVVVSEHRWIRANFTSSPLYVKEVTYRKLGSGLGSLFGGQHKKWKWVEIVKPDGLRSTTWGDDPQRDVFIRELPLSKVQVIKRVDYKVEFENQPLSLVEISFPNNIDIVFRESDGNIVYAALQEAAKNDGHIQIIQENTAYNPTESLRKLKELLESGLVSEAEYELKKKEILARL